ncbi:hypothetical protein K7432_005853 [Basidiobolus ranarum]|uniref:Uncharacterized protein n=1 Tax=Basidiobolus ranarum TaxID=34480 RepID=A0ABR2W2J6_9FUNG
MKFQEDVTIMVVFADSIIAPSANQLLDVKRMRTSDISGANQLSTTVGGVRSII